MARFSYRQINRRTLQMFNQTGKIVRLVMRKGDNTPTPYTPGQLFTAHEDPPEDDTNYTYRYIKANYEEMDNMMPAELGRQRIVKAKLTVPLLFQELLAAAEYVDPLLDGSRFTKTSAIIERGRLFCEVEIQSVTLKNVSEVVQ